jgi:hypothetical protein
VRWADWGWVQAGAGFQALAPALWPKAALLAWAAEAVGTHPALPPLPLVFTSTSTEVLGDSPIVPTGLLLGTRCSHVPRSRPPCFLSPPRRTPPSRTPGQRSTRTTYGAQQVKVGVVGSPSPPCLFFPAAHPDQANRHLFLLLCCCAWAAGVRHHDRARGQESGSPGRGEGSPKDSPPRQFPSPSNALPVWRQVSSALHDSR